MPVISNNSTSSLPFFVENQILRANDLNALVQGLMEQLRQNRTYNIGIGIVNGLNVQLVNDNQHIKLTGGFGISSDGYSFETNECIFTYIREAGRLSECKVSSQDCEEYRQLIENMGLAYEINAFELTTGDGNQNQNANSEINEGGWEEIENYTISLKEDTRFDEPDFYAVDRETAESMGFCILYIWCEEEIARTSCFNDCEQKGADQNMSLKAVLFPRYLYEHIFNSDSEGGQGNENPGQISLAEVPKLWRFGYAMEGENACIKLCEIENWTDFYETYRNLCLESVLGIINAYQVADVEFYKKIFPDSEVQFDALQGWLENTLLHLEEGKYPLETENDCPDIQYLYTYLQELILAYQAFYSVADEMVLLGNSDDSGNDLRCLFPKHISMGTITLNFDESPDTTEIQLVANEDICRSARRLPDVFPQTLEQREKALALFQRMVAIVTESNITLPTTALQNINITPDIRRYSYLDSRAMPFYYRSNIQSLWQTPDAHYPLSHHYLLRNSEHILFTEIEPYDFYRIEGHLGQALITAKDQIESHRSCFNLAFDIREVRIGPGGGIDVDQEEFNFKDLESAFQNARWTILNELKIHFAHDEEPDTLDILDLSEILSSYSSLATVVEELFSGLDIDCCDDNPPQLPDNYLSPFIDAYNEVQLSGFNIDISLRDCIVDLITEYYQRRIDFERAVRFACFAQSHPGLEHRGGVPRGGTFVMVYKEDLDADGNPVRGEEGNPIRTVVADFCLPYLCCSEGVVIRNEIRKINNELIIPKVVFCFQIDPETNAPSPDNEAVIVQAQPPRGTLTVSYPGGTAVVFDDFQSDTDSPIPLNDLISLNDQGQFPSDNGELILTFTYELGGVVETKVITVYKKPIVNCDKIEDEAIYENGNDENGNEIPCRYVGRRCRIDLVPSIPLNEIDSLILSDAIGGDTIIIDETGLNPEVHNDSEYPNFVINEDNQLESFTVLATTLVRNVSLQAKKQTCTDECIVTVKSNCPADLSIENIYTYAFSQEEDTVTFDETQHEITEVPLEISYGLEDTGFIAVRVIPPGFNLTGTIIFSIGDDAPNSLPIPTNYIIRKDIETPGEPCAIKNRYFIIYDLKQALAVLGTFAEASSFYLQSSDLENLTDPLVPRDPNQSSYSIELAYALSNGFENCGLDRILLPIPIVTSPDPIDEEKPTDSDNTGSTDVPPPSDPEVRGTGSRGLSAALLSPTGNPLSAEANQLLNQRRAAQMEELNRIREDQADVAKLAGFRYATSLISLQADEATLEAAYRKALNPLFTSYTRTEDKNRKATLEQLIIATHHALLDKLTVQAQDIGTDILASIAEQMQKTAAAGISIGKLKRNWKASDLRKVFDKNRVNLLNRIIKT